MTRFVELVPDSSLRTILRHQVLLTVNLDVSARCCARGTLAEESRFWDVLC